LVKKRGNLVPKVLSTWHKICYTLVINEIIIRGGILMDKKEVTFIRTFSTYFTVLARNNIFISKDEII